MSNNNFCPNCGSRINERARFCINCGYPIATVSETSVDNAVTAAGTVKSGEAGSRRMDNIRYRMYVKFIIALGVAMKLLLRFIGHNYTSFLTVFMTLICVAVIIGAIFSFYYISVKRFHDLNKSGWNVLLLLIPIYGLYIWFILMRKDGNIGPNNYGASN